MLRIGLTGGIGSGKSTTADLFAAHGIPVIDADAISHQLTLPGTPATKQILHLFGPAIASSSGVINRQLLGRLIFNDARARAQLEEILHPLINAEIRRQLNKINAPYCLLVIPLLFETGQRNMVDRALVLDVDEDTQLARVAKRDERTATEIHAILSAQTDRNQRLRMADDIIINTGDLAALSAQVDALHRRYLALAFNAPSQQ